MATYATAEELRSYVNVTAVELPDADAERVLEAAEKDIDRMARLWGVGDNGMVFVPADLQLFQRNRLRDATCAQAEYRLKKGEEFFVEEQVPTGEFATTSRAEPRIGPKAKEELVYANLLATGGHVRG